MNNGIIMIGTETTKTTNNNKKDDDDNYYDEPDEQEKDKQRGQDVLAAFSQKMTLMNHKRERTQKRIGKHKKKKNSAGLIILWICFFLTIFLIGVFGSIIYVRVAAANAQSISGSTEKEAMDTSSKRELDEHNAKLHHLKKLFNKIKEDEEEETDASSTEQEAADTGSETEPDEHNAKLQRLKHFLTEHPRRHRDGPRSARRPPFRPRLLTDDGGDDHDDEYSRKKKKKERKKHDDTAAAAAHHEKRHYSDEQLDEMLQEMDHDVTNNVAGGIQWVNRDVLIPIQGDYETAVHDKKEKRRRKPAAPSDQPKTFFNVHRKREKAMKWEQEYQKLLENKDSSDSDVFRPAVDYTALDYEYPPLMKKPPKNPEGKYPLLKPLQQIMDEWPQDQDVPHDTIHETLLHFNFSNPKELKMAERFRDAHLPFKLIDVPEVHQASLKWTDDYVSANFQSSKDKGGGFFGVGGGEKDGRKMLQNGPRAEGHAQESTNHFFAFFNHQNWDLASYGLPPVRNNDWSYEKWSQHARYADAVSLKEDQPHFYWQAGIPREERLNRDRDTWTFISRDLPSFSSTKENFIVFHPESQKGIQCRFGERGVTAAIHYDSGRNMIAMITGAKRYILMPPNQCSKLGIATDRMNPIYRHSLLDFGHLNHYKGVNKHDIGRGDDSISQLEYDWMKKAGKAQTVETVLKSGEVLYIPSFWFHYIVSLQKSAQCNVRSGIDEEGHEDVEVCQD